jgi:diguanylate cyclase (GGDEF)-like protein/PAS domain S-box-containing protein
MVISSTNEGRRRTASFGRVALEGEESAELPYEVSRNIGLGNEGITTLTWIYDLVDDVVLWSAPIEEFFGFAEGSTGFLVNGSPLPGIGDTAADGAAKDPVIGPTLILGDGGRVDLGAELLAPILAPVRAGAPLAAYELFTRVTCPDGTEHHLVIRASAVGANRHPVRSGRLDPETYLSGVIVDVTAQERFERELAGLVDRYRLLTEVSPDLVIVHQNGLLVYGNRAAVKAWGAESMNEYYGHPITDYIHPNDLNDTVQRIAALTEEGQFVEHGEARIVAPDGTVTVMEATSIRTTWGGEPAYQVILRDVSERRAAEASARYRASLIAHVSDAIIGIDADGRIESWNEAAQAIYGWSEEEVGGMSIGAVVTADRTDSASVLRRGQHTHHRKDGSSVDVLVSIDPLIDDDLQPSGWVVVCTELTDARQAEAGRRAAEERYEAVVASLSEGIILFDESGDMSAHNQAAATILGDRLTEQRGHRMFTGDAIATSADGQPLTPDMFPHVRTLKTGASEDGVVIGVTDGAGRFQWLSMSSRLLSGASQTDAPMVVCSFTDVTDRKEAESKLHWLAFHDSLTGLGNRSFFNDQLEHELMISMQHGTNLAVLFIDLDRFKLVNDSFGHASGDELLLELARRFKTASRKGDVVSRFSGDEFVVLCPNVRDLEHALAIAAEYSLVTEAPFRLSTGRSVVVTCSVGVAYVVEGDQTAQDILQQADTAMFKAKNSGRARIEVFDESLRVNSVARLEIYDDLRHSIEHDELVVHYQPIASVATGRIVALEALVRWNHPTRGLLGPMEFIPFAEETDLIFSLGRWVLREACNTMANWRNDVPGAEDAYITVNLSVHQLSDSSLLDSIAEALSDSGLPPEALVLEVTESLLMSETAETVDALSGIHDMGVGLAIDDFGTGESSLARLKRFPVKVLKIDKSFVDGLGILETDEAIVAAIVQLSKALGLVVLAEGVETPAQLERVAALGCDLYQGYLMSRPVIADHIDFAKRAETTPQSDLPA